jgi:hypothetical protein
MTRKRYRFHREKRYRFHREKTYRFHREKTYRFHRERMPDRGAFHYLGWAGGP